MLVRILYFAGVADLVGRAEEELNWSVPEKATIEELSAELLRRSPALHLQGVRFAVNEEFVSSHHVLRSGDVVALIPPVSGG